MSGKDCFLVVQNIDKMNELRYYILVKLFQRRLGH